MELPRMIRPELQELPQIGDADVTVVWVGKQGVRIVRVVIGLRIP